jgi:GGDEF domain-containing protein
LDDADIGGVHPPPSGQPTVEALLARIAELERDVDRYARQNAELLILQQVFTTMNSTMDVDDILGMVLRGICEVLGFARVVLFDVHGGIARRYLENEPGTYDVVPSASPGFVPTKTMRAMTTGRQDFAIGSAADGQSPLEDVVGAYAILPLKSRGTIRGLLYVDGTPSPDFSEIELQVLFDFGTQAGMALENARLYHETQRLLSETRALASTDPLTGLPNRRSLLEQLERVLWNAERYRFSLTVAFFDLDDLKRINDEGGHAAGDDALRRFASALKRAARKGDIVAIHHADQEAADIVARRALEHVRCEGLHCSAGLAIFPHDGTTASALIYAADRALYVAKRSGKDRYTFSTVTVK